MALRTNKFILSLSVLSVLACSLPALSKDYVYITNIDANLISVIDGDEGLVVREVPVGVEACDIAIDPGGRFVAVTHEEKRGEVWVLDRNTLEVNHKVLLYEGTEGRKANGFFAVFGKDGKKLYVANQYSGLVYVVDPVGGEITGKIVLNKALHIKGALISPDGRSVYFPDLNGRKVYVVDTVTDRVRDIIRIDGAPSAIGISPDGRTLYVADGEDSSLIYLNLKTKKAAARRIPIGNDPGGVAVSGDGRFIYVSNMMSYSVTKIDAERMEAVANVPAGAYSIGIVVSPDGKWVYVTNYNENTVSIIDATSNKEIARVATAMTPFKIAIYGSP